ncbi:unnamed protein product [Ambrosiozyma monospora]|uniref:Unnamed protein product n=1 Tax=Ambrosiozyma monospora TaxID=43982 RepID=A0A9W6Z190_AMBMO|nr:unnamed protein product [Ambrosiozyma monospora]
MFLEYLFSTTSSVHNTNDGGLSYQQITFLTFQAVIEVVIICLSGFWAARSGLLNNEATKMISRLNVDLFTPALIFTKLASSLSLKKLLEVIIIPILYAVTTAVSLLASGWISSLLHLTEPETNFVTAMAVFGNSNSLPVSLTLALSYTLPGLEWDDIPDDNADKIASRGLIYLLIFQQLGQMLRWSWGYNKLLKPVSEDVIYHKISQDDEESRLIEDNDEQRPSNYGSTIESENNAPSPVPETGNTAPVQSSSQSTSPALLELQNHELLNNQWSEGSSISSGDSLANDISSTYKNSITSKQTSVNDSDDEHKNTNFLVSAWNTFYGWMNPPLWAMLVSVIVASIPALKYEFYEANGFVQNTLALAIKQLGSVSIPLILVVLGANLAPSADIPPACPNYSKMIFGSLISRMVLPSLVLLPLITFSVKYINLSIMDDPIFLITSFLLITSPPAIQLSQICQLNEIYQKEMAGVLFYGYVILTLPVTIAIVVSALECLKWARS